VEAGQASNLGYCPTSGQQGFVGVNWLAIENLGAAVPNLEGMSDTNVQQWLSSIPNYNPDATDANYPAGDAFKELLPTAAKAYADGKIPSTTPWISFFDSLNGGYSYEYLDGYTYDLPSTDYSSIGRLVSSDYGTGFLGASTSDAWDQPYPSTSFGGAFPATTSFSGPFPATTSFSGSFPAATSFYGPFPAATSFSGSFPTATSFSGSLSSVPSCCGHANSLGLGAQFDSQYSNSPLPHTLPAPLGSFYPSFGAPLSQPIGTTLLSPSSGFGAPFPSQQSFPALPNQPIYGQPPFQPLLGPAWSGFSR